MKIQIHDIGIPWWPWNYRYRVTAIGKPKVDAPSLVRGRQSNSAFGYDNELFTLESEDHNHNYDFHPNYDYLRPDIRNWLHDSLNYMDWTTEHPSEFGEECGILFRRRKDVMMFKLAWG